MCVFPQDVCAERLAGKQLQNGLVDQAVARHAVARIDPAERRALMQSVPPIFRARWLPMMRQEAAHFRAALPDLLARVAAEHGVAAPWAGRQITDALNALGALVPEADFSPERSAVEALSTRLISA